MLQVLFEPHESYESQRTFSWLRSGPTPTGIFHFTTSRHPVISLCLVRHHKFTKRIQQQGAVRITMPIHTRSGKALHTAGDPYAPSRWFDPDRVTRPRGEDDGRTAIALFVVDEFPLQTVKKILNDNLEDIQHPIIWLADSYDSIPDFDFHPRTPSVEGTESDEVDDDWHSPFTGSSIKDCVNFMRNTPRPPKGLNIKFCAVLQKNLYEAHSSVFICKARGEKEPQTIPCHADKIGLFYTGFDRGDWRENHRMQILF